MENKRIKILGDYYHLSRTQLVEAGLARSALEKLDQYSKRIQNQKAECLFANKLLRAKRIKEFNVRVEKAIASGNLKVFSKLIKNKEIQRNSMPKILKYKGKVYKNDNVLRGFSVVATDQSEDPITVPGVFISKEYISMKHSANLAIATAKMDDSEILPLNRDSFKAHLKRTPKEKAQDSKSLSIEHLLFADQAILDLIMDLLNTIVSDLDWTSHPLINLGLATMLPLFDDPTSFRRI